jgi:cytochrome c oxidase subunit II
MWNYPLAPEQASNFATRVDAIFYVITALTIFFTVVVLALVVFFAVKYRVGSNANRARPQHENLRIEIAWSVPPLLLGLGIFAWSATDFIDMRRPPEDAMEIFVIGKQWMWHVQHPNGVREMNTLHVPVGRPVKLTMISQDVIHAFYIPAFRVQYHVIPGRYTYMWFTPTKPGRYYLFCNMYCGTQHSEMGGYVYVQTQAEYAQWLAQGGDNPQEGTLTLADHGRQLYEQLNCANCHTGTDTERAPTLYGLYGSQRLQTNGRSMQANDDYIRESIINPYSTITAGYENTMPADYKTQLSEEQIRRLIEYIKTLGQARQAAEPSNSVASPARPGGNQ